MPLYERGASMARRSEFLSSLGMLFAIFKKVMDLVLKFGGSDENFLKINTDHALAEDLAAVIVGKARVVCLSDKKEMTRVEKFISTFLVDGGSEGIGHFPEDALAIMSAELFRALRELTYRMREIIRMRTGIGHEYAYTVEETARIFKVTNEQVRQLEWKAIKSLQASEYATRIREEYNRATSETDDTPEKQGG